MELTSDISKTKNHANKFAFKQILVAIGPIIITGALGMTEAYSAILLPQLEHENSTIKIDTELSSWLASMSSFPMSGGCLVGAYLMQKIGRRAIHIWACIPLVLGWFLIAAAPNANIILVGRFLTGVSDGLLGPPTGVYIAETSHPNLRGVLIMSTVVALTFGIFLVHLLGTFFTWRMTAWISGVIPIPFAIFMCFVPESPSFLAKIKKFDEAKAAFYWCRGSSEESQKELDELFARQQELENVPKQSIAEIVKSLSKPEFWKPTVIISILFITAQMSGNQAMGSYSIQIIQECGLASDEYLTMIGIDTFRLLATIVSCILVSKLPRRSLVMLGGYGVCSVLFLLSCHLYLAPLFASDSSIIVLTLLSAYVFLIAVGLVPLTWTMMGEIFPLAYRSLGTAVTSSVCYVVLYLVVLTFPYLLTLFGNISGVFMFYCAFTFVGTIILTIYLPETKDKPLYIIEDYYKS
ncbi:hypothetical protein WA026_010669 [Henosepilachna vigintioctopunctata]|uniref:Major facilitator superfamily (MFS) profile domain-containing protein n=1 Tax=Henosepilachna vigintioctopunctata TaxID=420089 RepID=A0AAW1UW82_9CUCU